MCLYNLISNCCWKYFFLQAAKNSQDFLRIKFEQQHSGVVVTAGKMKRACSAKSCSLHKRVDNTTLNKQCFILSDVHTCFQRRAYSWTTVVTLDISDYPLNVICSVCVCFILSQILIPKLQLTWRRRTPSV